MDEVGYTGSEPTPGAEGDLPASGDVPVGPDAGVNDDLPEHTDVPEVEPMSDDELDELSMDVDLAAGEADAIGRLVQPDEGAHTDVEGAEVALDAGASGGGLSAEEAAMHLEP